MKAARVAKEEDDNDRAARGTIHEFTKRGLENSTDQSLAAHEKLSFWLDQTDILDAKKPLTTTFKDLDNALDGGFEWGGLYVISGTTGQGKSTLAQNLAFRIASLEESPGVFLFTLEDRPKAVARKWLAIQSRLPVKVVSGKFGKQNLSQIEEIEKAKEIIRQFPLSISTELSQLDAMILRMGTLRPARGVFIVDQSSHIEVLDKKTEYDEHKQSSKAMARAARELNAIVIVVTQIGTLGARAARDGKKPGMQDIRSSQTWPNDADGVIVIGTVHKGEKCSRMECSVDKHRHGFGGNPDFSLAFYKSEQRIEEWDESLTESIPSKDNDENKPSFTLQSLVAQNFFNKVPMSQPQLIEAAYVTSPKIPRGRLIDILKAISENGDSEGPVFKRKIEKEYWYCTVLEELNFKSNGLTKP